MNSDFLTIGALSFLLVCMMQDTLQNIFGGYIILSLGSLRCSLRCSLNEDIKCLCISFPNCIC